MPRHIKTCLACRKEHVAHKRVCGFCGGRQFEVRDETPAEVTERVDNLRVIINLHRQSS